MRRVVQDVFRLSGAWDQVDLGSGVYLVSAGGELTLIDTGLRNKALVIMRRIYRLGLSPSHIRHVIVTHHHSDHIGSLAALKKITGARVIAHADDAPYIEGSLPQPGPFRPTLYTLIPRFRELMSTEPATVDIKVKDGDELDVAGGISIIHTPGHTPGSICIYLKQKNLVFCGDLIANRPGIKLPSMAFTEDVSRLKQSVRKLAGHEFDVICFGHGLPLHCNASRHVRAFAGRLR